MITDKFSFVEKRESSAAERKTSLRTYMKRRRGENENRDVKESLLVENFSRAALRKKRAFSSIFPFFPKRRRTS
ncbi:MAG: hypothetical protein ACLS4Z_05425 [Christensenellaceae bacterium]